MALARRRWKPDHEQQLSGIQVCHMHVTSHPDTYAAHKSVLPDRFQRVWLTVLCTRFAAYCHNNSSRKGSQLWCIYSAVGSPYIDLMQQQVGQTRVQGRPIGDMLHDCTDVAKCCCEVQVQHSWHHAACCIVKALTAYTPRSSSSKRLQPFSYSICV